MEAQTERWKDAMLVAYYHATLPVISRRLAEQNGQRRERTMSEDCVTRAVTRALELGEGVVYRDAGRVANAYRHPAWTTVCRVAIGELDGDYVLTVEIGQQGAQRSHGRSSDREVPLPRQGAGRRAVLESGVRIVLANPVRTSVVVLGCKR